MASAVEQLETELEPGEAVVATLRRSRTTRRTSGNKKIVTTTHTPVVVTDRRILELGSVVLSHSFTGLRHMQCFARGLRVTPFRGASANYLPGLESSPEQEARLKELVRRFDAGEIGLPRPKRVELGKKKDALDQAGGRKTMATVAGVLGVLAGLGLGGFGLTTLLGVVSSLMFAVENGFRAGLGWVMVQTLTGAGFGLVVLVLGVAVAAGAGFVAFTVRRKFAELVKELDEALHVALRQAA